ncbi:toll/interleukin-1 receptor domain-containing protein [Variovorax sp. GT1P44]|uniref:toll/interleukin-1 receptor domain-containing protein n=1 Tax=Variovorax sp. GT1P44 TaxID=3443742 RepID=UPI003F46AE7D
MVDALRVAWKTPTGWWMTPKGRSLHIRFTFSYGSTQLHRAARIQERVEECALADVFVSYSRKDKDFALRLTSALLDRKREAWVDWEGIAPTAEWMKAIFAAIEGASAFVFVCSPDSLASEICALELGHAVANKKRVIPIVCRDIDASQAPAAVASLNWIFMRDGDDHAAAMDALIVAIDTDFAWLSFHSRVLVRAVEWDRERHERSRLLRGADLKAAEAWVVQAGQGTRPEATELQRHYLRTSRSDATRRRRWLVGGSTALLLTAAVSAILALFNARQARVEEASALARKLAADSERVRTERPDLQVRALWLAAEAMQRAPSPSLEADQALRSLLAVMPRHLAAVPTGGARTGSLDDRRYGGELAIAPDGRAVAWTLNSGEAHVWTVGADAAAVRSWPGTGRTSRIAFDATGQLLATLSDRKSVRVRDIQSGRLSVAAGDADRGRSGGRPRRASRLARFGWPAPTVGRRRQSRGPVHGRPVPRRRTSRAAALQPGQSPPCRRERPWAQAVQTGRTAGL